MSIALGLAPSEQRVLDLLRYRGPMSRAELSRESDLAPPTLSRLIQQLLDRGLVIESEKVRDGQRGKPAQLVRLNPRGAFAAGIAVQSEYLEGCIVDMEGGVCASARLPLPTLAPDQVGAAASRMLGQLIAEAGIDTSRLIGAGVSMPGVALGAYGSGTRPEGNNDLPDEFEDWKPLDLQAFFAGVLELPCWLENSSKAVALAEMYYGEGQRLGSFAVMHIAYGFGGGLILDRRPFRGARGHAGEFGGLFPYSSIRPSGRDLLAYLGERIARPPRHVRDVVIEDIPEHLLHGWAERVYPCMHDLCRFLTVALDLDGIVLHGLIPEKLLHLLADLLRQRVPQTLPPELVMPRVVVSPLSASSLSVGAASLPLHYTTAATP
ncbi:ROK family transcriptional regulator [Pseudoxanthomonas beigongshangi]|uniref:ROK family transcriptional regulator n=1 Tax=Pseudoxanthomonas beigongshangi TaxID=2782537 RepID=UPI00193B2FA9|nr:ROK family transcriptional regulator [Pseudoxanthomonas beigongshangi]